jgi:UDP-glucose 4-epimerase
LTRLKPGGRLWAALRAFTKELYNAFLRVEASVKGPTVHCLDGEIDWAIRKGVPLVVGDTGDRKLVGQITPRAWVQSIIHFAASAIVPDLVKDSLGYSRNNTVSSRALIETAFRNNVRQFIFSSTCAVYGNPAQVPVTEEAPRRSRPMTRRS